MHSNSCWASRRRPRNREILCDLFGDGCCKCVVVVVVVVVAVVDLQPATRWIKADSFFKPPGR